ncbi:hypothetical protein PSPO_a3214 [Pseudoalteromonas spongiae UST010723-006]|nr:hypothetical protein PSPO_a3214 [Pseudoalteromonas spongiae UST010723-006]
MILKDCFFHERFSKIKGAKYLHDQYSQAVYLKLYKIAQ